jgi:hypothetical protein
MPGQTGGWDGCFSPMNAVDLKEVSARLRPRSLESSSHRKVAAIGIQLSALDGSILEIPMHLASANANGCLQTAKGYDAKATRGQ